jgi:hypothetical protein
MDQVSISASQFSALTSPKIGMIASGLQFPSLSLSTLLISKVLCSFAFVVLIVLKPFFLSLLLFRKNNASKALGKEKCFAESVAWW